MFIVVDVALYPVGNVSFAGLPLVRGPSNKKNLMWHGYSIVLALLLLFTLIYFVMIPSLAGGFGELGELSLFDSVTVWSHAVSLTTAEVLGIMLVASWLSHGPSKMTCSREKK